MSDTKWLLRQGFEICDETADGFVLLKKLIIEEEHPALFTEGIHHPVLETNEGLLVYYSNRCPFTEYHVQHSLIETAQKRNLPLTIVKLNTSNEARKSPCPSTIFGMYFNGEFITTDVSVCMDSRFDKIMETKVC